MELPVENKKHAISQIIVLSFLLLALFSLVLINSYSHTWLYLIIIIFVAHFTLSIKFIDKHNIQKINLSEDNLEIYHRGKKTIIRIDEIKQVHSGLNDYIDMRGGFSVMYQLDLKKKYKFGNKLYFKYDINSIREKEPVEMVFIKDRLNQRVK